MPIRRTPWGQIMFSIVAAGALCVSLTTGAAAAEAFKMGVIDPQAVLEKSKSGKKALDGLKEYVSTRQKLLSRDEEELRNTEKTLKESTSKRSSAPRFKSIKSGLRSLTKSSRVSRRNSSTTT